MPAIDGGANAELGAALRYNLTPSPDAPAKTLKIPLAVRARKTYDLSEKTAGDGSTTYSVKRTRADRLEHRHRRRSRHRGRAVRAVLSTRPTDRAGAGDKHGRRLGLTRCVERRRQPRCPRRSHRRPRPRRHHGASFAAGRPRSVRHFAKQHGHYPDGSGAPAATAPAGLPVMALGDSQPPPAPRCAWDDQPSVKFDILPTGTTLSAGVSRAPAPIRWLHNTLSADQKLYGPLHVSTAVTDVGETTENKSVTARFKFELVSSGRSPPFCSRRARRTDAAVTCGNRSTLSQHAKTVAFTRGASE